MSAFLSRFKEGKKENNKNIAGSVGVPGWGIACSVAAEGCARGIGRSGAFESRRQACLLCFLMGLILYASCPSTYLIHYVSLSKEVGENLTGKPEPCLAQEGYP